jgi:hypothetical protein
MYLTAISIGYAVPRKNFDTSVHSVFQSALNLRLNKKNKLLTLLASGEADLPQGIRLDTPEGFSFEEFQTDELAVCWDGILYFKNKSLAIQLSGARRWKCNLPALRADTSDPVVADSWNIVWEALNKRQLGLESEIVAGDLLRSDKSAQRIVPGKSGEAMRDLVNATQRYDLTDISPVNSLIGLGSGLTPSGDDLLVGYIAGLWCTVRDENSRAQFTSSLAKTIIRISRQTNDISRTYLYHAARGQVSSRLANLAEAIRYGENPDRLLVIAETAMRVGHTSGMDAVTGLLIGLTVWDSYQMLSK